MRSDDVLRHKLFEAAHLDPRTKLNQARPCKICQGVSAPFDIVDFNKFCSVDDYLRYGLSGIAVSYFRCNDCELIFTEFFDDWTISDFNRLVYNEDYVLVDPDYIDERPKEMARWVENKLPGLGKNARILDYGSGNGLLSELLAESGFLDLSNYDPISTPTRPSGEFDIVFAFEVIEHSPEPLATFREIASFLREGGCLIVSQALQPDDIESVRGSWWYLAPRNGHVSTYSLTTLRHLARDVGLTLRVLERTMIAFVKGRPSAQTSLALERFRSRICLRSPILAPAGDRWHDVEGKRFRWSASCNLEWDPVWLDAGPTEIRLPVLLEPREGFASECQYVVDGRVIPTKWENSLLRAEVDLPEPKMVKIEIVCPELVTPRSQGSHDDRYLGIAVVADEVPLVSRVVILDP